MSSYIRASYFDTAQCCQPFNQGVELLEQSRHGESVEYFRRALNSVTDADPFYYKYQSYYGLSCLLNGDASAIGHCRHAVDYCPYDGDVCMNLARAELLMSNRLRALETIELGLSFSSGHSGLRLLRTRVGVRARKPLPLLPRGCFLSHFVGRRLRKNK